MRKFGTRSEVFDGQATMTRGGLKKDDLMLSRTMKIVSKKKSEMAKASYAKYGFRSRAEKPKTKEPSEKKEPKEEPKEVKKAKKTKRRRKKNVAE